MIRNLTHKWVLQFKMAQKLCGAYAMFVVIKQNNNRNIVFEYPHKAMPGIDGIFMNHNSSCELGQYISSKDIKKQSPSFKGNYAAYIYSVCIKKVEFFGEVLFLFDEDKQLETEEEELLSGICSNISDQINIQLSFTNPAKEINPNALDYLLDSINGIPWRMNFKTMEFTYIGEQVVHITGYKPEEWPNLKEWSAAIHPDDREGAVDYCFNESIKGDDHLFEYRLVKKDGEVIWLQDVVKVSLGEDGEPLELNGFMIDITRQKHKEQYDMLLQNQLKHILRATNTVMDIVDHEGNIIFHSHENINAISQKCYQHFSNRNEKCEACPRRKKIKSKSTFYYNQEDKTYQVTAYPFEVEQGKLYMGEVRVDITDRVKRENEMAKLKNQLEFSMKAGSIAFVEYDVSSSMLSVNHVFNKITGYDFSNHQVELDWLFSRVHNDDIKWLKTSFIRTSTSKTNQIDIEFRLLNASNVYIWVNFSGLIKSTSEGSFLVSGIIKDITPAKKLLGDLLVEKNRSLKAMEAKSMFLANMSHEIRTPMNAIIGFSELLGKHIAEEPYKGYIKSIKASGKVLLALINDLLDLEKIEAGKMLVKKDNTDFVILVDEIVQTFAMMANEKGLELKINKDSTIPGTILIDSLKLRQILLNLVNNAIKFTEKGTVSIDSDFVPNANTSTGTLTFSVTDTGIGIKKEKQATIFEPFIQDKNANDKDYEGTGLGLSIVQKLVAMLGGSITLSSQPDKGSVFTIVIPDVEASHDIHAELSEILPEKVDYAKEKILIAERKGSDLEVLEAVCNSLNLECKTASNIDEIIKQVHIFNPKVIILDAELDGALENDYVNKLKNKTMGEPGVLAITSVNNNRHFKKLFHKGFNGIITKPLVQHELVNELNRFIKKNTQNTAEKQIEMPEFSLDEKNILCHTFHKTLIPIWVEFDEYLSSDNLQVFSHELKKLNEEVSWKALHKFSKKLDSAIDSYDFESIQKLLSNFKYFVDLSVN